MLMFDRLGSSQYTGQKTIEKRLLSTFSLFLFAFLYFFSFCCCFCCTFFNIHPSNLLELLTYYHVFTVSGWGIVSVI